MSGAAVAKTVGMTAPSASSAPASGASLTAEEHPSKKRARDEAVPGAIVEQGRVADPARPVRRRLNQKTPDVKKARKKKRQPKESAFSERSCCSERSRAESKECLCLVHQGRDAKERLCRGSMARRRQKNCKNVEGTR